MGTIRETVRVKANDDVYQRIIQKQQDAKRESEKKTWDLLKIRNANNLKMNLLLAFGLVCLCVGRGGVHQKPKNQRRGKCTKMNKVFTLNFRSLIILE